MKTLLASFAAAMPACNRKIQLQQALPSLQSYLFIYLFFNLQDLERKG
jgi:hypothetical protein